MPTGEFDDAINHALDEYEAMRLAAERYVKLRADLSTPAEYEAFDKTVDQLDLPKL